MKHKILLWKNAFIASWLDFLFPRICLHCSSLIEEDHFNCCKGCFESLEFAIPEDYCRACGVWREDNSTHCSCCQKRPSPFYQVLSAFDEQSLPAFSLQRKYQTASHSYLIKGAAAFMALHYTKHGLQWPELITHVPSTFWKKYTRGFCPASELAKVVASLFKVPHVSVIKSSAIEEKKVLLIGDSLCPSFFEAGETLVEGNPHSIYGLTFRN